MDEKPETEVPVPLLSPVESPQSGVNRTQVFSEYMVPHAAVGPVSPSCSAPETPGDERSVQEIASDSPASANESPASASEQATPPSAPLHPAALPAMAIEAGGPMSAARGTQLRSADDLTEPLMSPEVRVRNDLKLIAQRVASMTTFHELEMLSRAEEQARHIAAESVQASRLMSAVEWALGMRDIALQTASNGEKALLALTAHLRGEFDARQRASAAEYDKKMSLLKESAAARERELLKQLQTANEAIAALKTETSDQRQRIASLEAQVETETKRANEAEQQAQRILPTTPSRTTPQTPSTPNRATAIAATSPSSAIPSTSRAAPAVAAITRNGVMAPATAGNYSVESLKKMNDKLRAEALCGGRYRSVVTVNLACSSEPGPGQPLEVPYLSEDGASVLPIKAFIEKRCTSRRAGDINDAFLRALAGGSEVGVLCVQGVEGLAAAQILRERLPVEDAASAEQAASEWRLFTGVGLATFARYCRSPSSLSTVQSKEASPTAVFLGAVISRLRVELESAAPPLSEEQRVAFQEAVRLLTAPECCLAVRTDRAVVLNADFTSLRAEHHRQGAAVFHEVCRILQSSIAFDLTGVAQPVLLLGYLLLPADEAERVVAASPVLSPASGAVVKTIMCRSRVPTSIYTQQEVDFGVLFTPLVAVRQPTDGWLRQAWSLLDTTSPGHSFDSGQLTAADDQAGRRAVAAAVGRNGAEHNAVLVTLFP